MFLLRIAILLLGFSLAGTAAATDADRAIWIGGNDTISQPVQGSVVAIGGNVTVNAPVTKGAHIVAGSVTIAQGANITGDVKVAAGNVTMDGSIDGALKVAAGRVRINGPVTGNASIAAGTLELGPAARIQGKLTFHGDDLRQDPAAQVAGGVVHVAPHTRWYNRSSGDRFLHGWAWTIGLMVLAGILAATLPGPSNRMANELREHPGSTLLSGFLAFTAIPIAGVLLMLTIVGIPIALLGLMAYGVMLLLGYVWVAVVAGGMLLDRVKPEVAAVAAWRAGFAVLAMLAIALAARVPYLGGWVHFAALVAGVGMVAAVVLRRPQSVEGAPA